MQPRPRSEPREHPIVAWTAIAAVLLAAALIFAAHLELNGTRELEVLLAEAPSTSANEILPAPLQGVNREETYEAAVVTSRWATGFAQ